jgi:hypothetical protein
VLNPQRSGACKNLLVYPLFVFKYQRAHFGFCAKLTNQSSDRSSPFWWCGIASRLMAAELVFERACTCRGPGVTEVTFSSAEPGKF